MSTENLKVMEEINNLERVEQEIKKYFGFLNPEWFFAFVGINGGMFQGIAVAFFKKNENYGIIINNAYKPTDPKCQYFIGKEEEVISYIKKSEELKVMIMGDQSEAYYLKLPLKEDREIDLNESINLAYEVAGVKNFQIIIPSGDKCLKELTKALLPRAEVLCVEK